jgi:riboflavin synthase
MFTGIVEELGRVASIESLAEGSRIVIEAPLVTSDIKDGDSIAVNGVCLTALETGGATFAADVSPETLRLTTLYRIDAGARVNLERAMTPSARFGGHIMQGHVDGRGSFVSATQEGDFYTVRFSFPTDLARYMVHKGSIAVEGISLTIAELGDDYFDIAVIPKTWTMTNLSTLSSGDEVNLEVDVIAKYVERMLGSR